MPIYPTLAVAAAVAVVLLELAVLRTGIFRDSAYWVAMAICFAFMIPVDGWLTKLSAPIVIYREEDTTGIRPIWDILLEEYAYAFALLTVVILVWEHRGAAARRREAAGRDEAASGARP
jgi:lycopene cyclase domain-containing protein